MILLLDSQKHLKIKIYGLVSQCMVLVVRYSFSVLSF
nr:MAG TPA: hypothetical protein [Caudoviricetes sp.]